MKKILVPAGAAILAGLLAGLIGAWMTLPPAPAEAPAAEAPADSADTLHALADAYAAGATREAGTENVADAQTVLDHAPPASPPITRDSPIARVPGVAAGVAEAVPVPQPYAEPVTATDSAKRLAKVFAAMRPAEAALVLEQLSDAEARDVLLAMPDRAAGAILAHFEPGRAATISRVLLRRGT